MVPLIQLSQMRAREVEGNEEEKNNRGQGNGSDASIDVGYNNDGIVYYSQFQFILPLINERG